jgi:hypothetical protein
MIRDITLDWRKLSAVFHHGLIASTLAWHHGCLTKKMPNAARLAHSLLMFPAEAV